MSPTGRPTPRVALCRIFVAALLLLPGLVACAQRAAPPAGSVTRPDWAAGWGQDRYGVWADLQVNGAVQRLRWIPPGTFLMGSPPEEADRDRDEAQHRVTLTRGFWLGDTEMTLAFYQAVTGSPPERAPAEGRLPVTRVSWNDCEKMLARLNELKPGLGAALPTEAQWEYACRAGTAGPTYADLNAAAWHALNSRDRYGNFQIHAVGQKQPNVWGLYDMLGNVWELCRDFYGEYPGEPVIDPIGPATGRMRAERGGSYNSAAGACRVAWRWGSEAKAARANLGLRLCAEHPQP